MNDREAQDKDVEAEPPGVLAETPRRLELAHLKGHEAGSKSPPAHSEADRGDHSMEVGSQSTFVTTDDGLPRYAEKEKSARN